MTATATLVTTQAVELGRLGRPALLVEAALWPVRGLSPFRPARPRAGDRLAQPGQVPVWPLRLALLPA